MAIALKPRPYDTASYASSCVDAALGPGGPLHVALSDLLTEAEGIAMKAAGVPEGDDPGAEWPGYDHAWVMNSLAGEITDRMFEAVYTYLKAKAGPEPVA